MRLIALVCAFLFSTASFAPAGDREISPFLSTAQLRDLLRELGYAPVALTAEVSQITVDRDGWKVHLLVSLSKEGERVWLESKFSPIADPDQVPALVWRRLLETNDKIGPAHFVFDKTDKRIHLMKAFDNNHVSADRLKKEIAGLDTIIRETHEVWRAESFDSDKELLTVVPRLAEPSKIELRSLQGQWRIVRIELRGRVAVEEQLSASRPTLAFTASSAILKSGTDSDRNVKVRLDASTKLKQIDFVDEDGRVEKGVYQREGEAIRLCFSAPGGERPTRFVADEESGTWIMLLRR
jgi:uncharacterized protein (TIGR03067 family)